MGEVRDAFMKKFTGDQIPPVKNRSNSKKHAPHSDSAVNMLEVSNASAPASAIAGTPDKIFLASKRPAENDLRAWLFLAAALPAAGLIVLLSAQKIAPRWVGDDLTGYYLQA